MLFHVSGQNLSFNASAIHAYCCWSYYAWLIGVGALSTRPAVLVAVPGVTEVANECGGEGQVEDMQRLHSNSTAAALFC